MWSNRLQLNTAKTEILWCSISRRQNHLPSAAVRVGENHVLPSTTVHDLGILLESDVAMRSHVSRTVSGCFAVLRQLRSIRRSVSDSVFYPAVVSLVMPRLDHGNAHVHKTLSHETETRPRRSKRRLKIAVSQFKTLIGEVCHLTTCFLRLIEPLFSH